MSLKNTITDEAGKQMQKSMDFEILADVMVTMQGYVRVEIDYGFHRMWFEVKEWAAENCTGKHTEHRGIWLFERSIDAVAFKLRWA